MKNLNIRALFFSVLATLSCYIGCVRPDPETPDTYTKYPIDVKSDELPDGSFRLRWNAIKSADFIEYQVLKNTGDTVPFIENNTVKLGDIEIAKRIADIDSSFFVDSFSVPTKRTFLRVFAVLKDRNLSSRNVEMPIKTDAKEMALNANDVVYVSEDKKLLIADQVKFKFGVFNTGINEPEGIISTFNFLANLEMCYGKYNGSTEMHVPNNSQISTRNIASNNVFTFANFFPNFDAVMYDNSSNIYLAMSSFPPTIQFHKRSLLPNNFNSSSLISSTRFPLPPTTQALYVLRPARLDREVLAVSITSNNSDVIWFRYDALGQSATKINNLNTLRLNITKRPFSVAPDNQGFITSGKGLIFNRSMALVDSLKLPEPQVRYNDMVFSNDGTHLYCVRLGAERHERVVDSYSYPNYRFERSIPFKSTPLRIFQEGNALVLVGRSPNSPLLTMIEKIKL
jgi:hypothetical protein